MGTFQTVTAVFCNGASWGGFFASVPRVFFATVPACRGFFASVSTSRQGNFKTKKYSWETSFISVFFSVFCFFSFIFFVMCECEAPPPEMHPVFLHLLFLSVVFFE